MPVSIVWLPVSESDVFFPEPPVSFTANTMTIPASTIASPIRIYLRLSDKYQEIVSGNDELQKIVQEMDQPETEIAIPDAEDSGVEANKVMKAKDVLNVRADSSEDEEIIGMLDKGDKVTRVRVLDNGWAEIKYGEATGYVLNKYLKDVK